MRSKRLMMIKNKTLNTRTRQKESTQKREREEETKRRSHFDETQLDLVDRQLQNLKHTQVAVEVAQVGL